jgi:hypothetical protein
MNAGRVLAMLGERFVQWEVQRHDELAGDDDQWDGESRWEPDQLGQRDVLDPVSALYPMISSKLLA